MIVLPNFNVAKSRQRDKKNKGLCGEKGRGEERINVTLASDYLVIKKI